MPNHNHKDVIRLEFEKGHVLEVPLYYATRESSQIVQFLIVGTLADCKELEITHYLFAGRQFEKLDKGHYIQQSNKRKGRDRCSPNIKCSSTYIIKNPVSKKDERVTFTFADPNHMATLYQYLVPALNKHFVGVEHYRRIEYGGEWFQTAIIPTALGYPAEGIGARENVTKTGNKVIGCNETIDND